jgi:predicted NBD/HSP70 family sugar kinase
MNILMIDVGGTNVKLMASGHEGRRKVPSGPRFKPSQMVREVLKATEDWEYEAISMGYPGPVADGRPAREALNLGGGWLKFDFEKAFKRPVRFINDAAMHALASYRQGRMLFLGFGTGIGAAVIVDDVIMPLEIGGLRLGRSIRFCDALSDANRQRIGKRRWRKAAYDAIAILQDVFRPEDIVIGGGNGKDVEPLPKGCRLRDNQAAFAGASRLWPGADMIAEPYGSSWRIRKRPSSEHPPAAPAVVSGPTKKRKKGG